MIPADVVPNSWSYTLVPLIIVSAVILGIIFLIVLGVLIGRRISLKTGGVIALTLASILFLSGLWCIFLSPTATYTKTEGDYYRPLVTINGLSNWSYSVSAKNGDTLTVSLNFYYEAVNGDYNKTYDLRVNLYVYDPDNNVVWSEITTTYAYFSMKTLKTGMYRVEVQNPNQQAVRYYVQVTMTNEVTYRPLEPLGSWLTLISLPIFGLGIWASGVLASLFKMKKENQ